MDKFYQLSKEETKKKGKRPAGAAYRPAGHGTPGKIWKE